MATLSKPVGYEYEFVDQVPEDYFCKLCKHVAREAHFVSCCSECLCNICIEAIIQDKKPCPSCGDVEISTLPHVKYQRNILALEVCCTMKDRGCEWTGQLQHLNAHLDVTTGDCEYVDVECPKKCVQKVQKRYVDTHLANECPNRDYRCPHCNFANKFHIVADHFEVCSYYPLACPNRCGATFERDDLQDHMKMCRLEEVQCVFSDAGCQAKFIRENEDEHMDHNTQKHLALMPAATLKISQDFEQKLQEQQEVFERKIKALEDQFQTNRQVIEQQQQAISQLRREVGIHITFSNYQEEKARSGCIISPSMYTHPGGYKFKLELHPNGHGSGTGTHVSVWLNSLKSNHDAKLKVPVKFTITLQLLNQHRDQDHYIKDIHCEVNREMIGRPIGDDCTFISHTALEWNRDKQTQYLKDDCLRFRITKISVH